MRARGVLILAALSSMPGCEEDEPDSVCDDTVVTRADPAVDFTAFATFAIAPDTEYPAEIPPDLPPDTTVALSSANRAARVELLELGLTEVDYATGMPDLTVFSVAASESDTGVIYECVGGYYWYGWWYVWDPCAWLQPIPVEYEVATVLIGVADSTAEAVVFGGSIQGILECGDTMDRLNAGVSRIFADYPADQTGM